MVCPYGSRHMGLQKMEAHLLTLGLLQKHLFRDREAATDPLLLLAPPPKRKPISIPPGSTRIGPMRATFRIAKRAARRIVTNPALRRGANRAYIPVTP
jgi:hypothetical protein